MGEDRTVLKAKMSYQDENINVDDVITYININVCRRYRGDASRKQVVVRNPTCDEGNKTIVYILYSHHSS